MNTYKFELNNFKYKWYLNNNSHRDHDRPTWINSDGTKGWCQYGRCHRDNDKPAYINSNGHKSWCQYGRFHRDGNLPARIWPGGAMEYWVNGERIK